MIAGAIITDRDDKALLAIATGEPDLGLAPTELGDWLERPEIKRLVETAHWLAERRRRMQVYRAIERAMDHLSAALDAKADLTDNNQRAEVRRTATALGHLAITLLEGPIGTRRSRPAADFDPPCSPWGGGGAVTERHGRSMTEGAPSPTPPTAPPTRPDSPKQNGHASPAHRADPSLHLGACPPLAPPTQSSVLSPQSVPLSALSANSAVKPLPRRSPAALVAMAGTADTS